MEKTFEQTLNETALNLFNAYYPFYFKKYPRSKAYLRGKLYPYFIKVSKLFCIREKFDAKKFIKIQMMDGFKFPQQMANEKAWSDYIEKLPLLEEKDPEIDIVEKIVSAAIELKRYGTVDKWLTLIVNQRMVEEGKMKFVPYLFAFSFAFIEYFYNNCIFSYDLISLREEVFSLKNSSKIVEKIKQILKDDYYTFHEEIKEQKIFI